MRARSFAVSLVAVLLAVPLTLVAPSAALADGRSVDPLSLNPPLEHGNPACVWDDGLIVCHSTVPQYHDLGTFDGVIDCGNALLSQTVHWTLVRGIAYYNAKKDIVKLTYIDSYTGSFSNPANGKVAPWTQQDVATWTFTTPGDNSAGPMVMKELQKVYGPRGNVILTDAGTEVFSTPDYTRLSATGHHPIDDYFYAGDASGLAPLCRALS